MKYGYYYIYNEYLWNDIYIFLCVYLVKNMHTRGPCFWLGTLCTRRIIKTNKDLIKYLPQELSKNLFSLCIFYLNFFIKNLIKLKITLNSHCNVFLEICIILLFSLCIRRIIKIIKVLMKYSLERIIKNINN